MTCPRGGSLILILLLGLGFALRLYRLDAIPLRGDEAFAVRYWAAPPATVLRDLARWEPHPLGAFFGFWAWKSAVGDSEFAMRFLPLLGNWIGIAALAALARRIFHRDRAAVLAAALWAINPFLIWHAQDARNYALWAGLSPLAMLLLLRALDRPRPLRWALYGLVETLALYTFFLEAFMLPVQALVVFAMTRARAARRRALLTWAVLLVLLIPWLVQVVTLSRSGYQGTIVGEVAPARLLTWFLPTLLAGREFPAPWRVILPLGWCALLALAMGLRRPRRPAVLVGLGAWIALPAALLLLATTRMNVFHPRYLVAITPPLLLLTVYGLAAPSGERTGARRWALIAVQAGLLILPLLGLDTLWRYYRGEDRKAPDWPALAAYLDARAGPHDLVLKAAADPAFNYYYHGPAAEASLTPGVDLGAQLRPVLNFYGTIWWIGDAAEVEEYLSARWQALGTDRVAGFRVTQYRPWAIPPGEIAVPLDVTFGGVARLRGYTLQGPDVSQPALTVLLYWEPLRQAEVDYTVFVHLLGPPHPNGDPLWGQDDHRPRDGFASTLAWQPGTLIRDPYHLLDDESATLPPGEYTLSVGMYDPADPNRRLPVSGPDGAPLGDSLTLTALHWPPDNTAR